RPPAGLRTAAAAEFPGGRFHETLPTISSDVAILLTSSTPVFSVSAAPSSANTTPGGIVSYSVAVGSANGFTGTVGLATTGVPVGATASFLPATVTAPGSSQLTVATDAAIAPGTYPLTVTGTSSSTSHTEAITLVVSAPPTPDFTVTATPASRTVVRGASASYTISITPSGGFSAPVTLSASGLPTGTSGSFAPNPASDSSAFSVTTTSTAKVGGYTLTITAGSRSPVPSPAATPQGSRRGAAR